MFESEAKLYRFVGAYFRLLTADLDETKLDHAIAAGTQTPRWILGHLVLGNEYALKTLGVPGTVPQEWFTWFGPGSSPAKVPTEAPGKNDLIRAFETTHAAVLAALPTASKEVMQKKHSLPMKFLQELAPTFGELVAHLLTTHAATHLGQLSLWRRAMGMSEVLV